MQQHWSNATINLRRNRTNREVFGEETQLKEIGWTEEEIQLRKEEQNATN
jgi:hypothetical protein